MNQYCMQSVGLGLVEDASEEEDSWHAISAKSEQAIDSSEDEEQDNSRFFRLNRTG